MQKCSEKEREKNERCKQYNQLTVMANTENYLLKKEEIKIA